MPEADNDPRVESHTRTHVAGRSQTVVAAEAAVFGASRMRYVAEQRVIDPKRIEAIGRTPTWYDSRTERRNIRPISGG